MLLPLALALPHILYAVIWMRPQWWKAIFKTKEKAVGAFEIAAAVGKVLQFSAVIWWYLTYAPPLQLSKLSALGLGLGFLFICSGQVLNMAVYTAIKPVGIYYGCKLGYDVPWCTGFPFNTVPHPQYVGSVLTVWGLICMVWSQVPWSIPGGTFHWQLVTIGSYWTCLYAITGLVEMYMGGPPRTKDP